MNGFFRKVQMIMNNLSNSTKFHKFNRLQQSIVLNLSKKKFAIPYLIIGGTSFFASFS